MRILSWNCQGLGPALTENALGNLKSKVDPSLVFLMKTKNKSAKVDRVRKSLKFKNGRCFDPVGVVGGLALWSTDLVEVNIVDYSLNFIDTFITCKKTQKNCKVTSYMVLLEMLVGKSFGFI